MTNINFSNSRLWFVHDLKRGERDHGQRRHQLPGCGYRADYWVNAKRKGGEFLPLSFKAKTEVASRSKPVQKRPGRRHPVEMKPNRSDARVSSLHSRILMALLYSALRSPVAEESQHLDRAALQAIVAAAVEEFDEEILLLLRDGSKMRLGASESAGLNARGILSQCLRRLNELEKQTLDTTIQAFVRVVSEDLKNDQVVMLIVRGRGDIRLASGAGAHGKVRDMLNDALQAIGGERPRR